MIDVSLPPYNVKGDWTGSDATATDNTSALLAAINDAKTNPGLKSPDDGGSIGDRLILPKGTIMVSSKLVLPFGVSMEGASDYGTTLRMKSTFDPNYGLIDLGDAQYHLATFGGQLKNLCLSAPNSLAANWNVYMVYSSNLQDCGALLENVRIDGGQRGCFKGEIGYGGASMINLRSVFAFTNRAGLPALSFNYGESCLVDLQGIRVAGGRDPSNNDLPLAGTIGVNALGGLFRIRQFHSEVIDTGVNINLNAASTKMDFDMEFATGGPVSNSIITVCNNPSQLGKIRLNKIWRNGALQHTVINGQSGAMPIDSDILSPVVL